MGRNAMCILFTCLRSKYILINIITLRSKRQVSFIGLDRPTKQACQFDLLIMIFVSICLLGKQVLPIQVSNLMFHVECMIF